MQVNNNFKTVITRPTNGLLEVRELTGDVWLPRPYVECPVSDRDTDVVQTGIGKVDGRKSALQKCHFTTT